MALDHVIEEARFDELFAALTRHGYTIVGPTVRDHAIVYDEIRSTTDLPVGLTDEQDGGHYRLRRRDDEALFGYAVGPHSWKQDQPPAEVSLWRARVDERGGLVEVTEPPRTPPRYAFFGARSCELHAMGILDRVLLGARIRIQRIAPVSRTCSWWPCSAGRPAGPASACR